MLIDPCSATVATGLSFYRTTRTAQNAYNGPVRSAYIRYLVFPAEISPDSQRITCRSIERRGHIPLFYGTISATSRRLATNRVVLRRDYSNDFSDVDTSALIRRQKHGFAIFVDKRISAQRNRLRLGSFVSDLRVLLQTTDDSCNDVRSKNFRFTDKSVSCIEGRLNIDLLSWIFMHLAVSSIQPAFSIRARDIYIGD